MFGLNKIVLAGVFAIIIILIITGWLYTHDNKIIKSTVNNIILKTKILTKDDLDAVTKQNNAIGDGSIIDSLYPEPSGSDRQVGNQRNNNKAPNAYPYIENGLEVNSGDGATLELPYFDIPKQSSESATNPKILQCTETEVILCINGCCKEL